MGDNTFVLAADGWVQVTPCGEFPHVGAGVTQVIDRAACDRIAADFNGSKSDAIFPGVLVDFDHFSLDTEKSSEAAGWISVRGRPGSRLRAGMFRIICAPSKPATDLIHAQTDNDV